MPEFLRLRLGLASVPRCTTRCKPSKGSCGFHDPGLGDGGPVKEAPVRKLAGVFPFWRSSGIIHKRWEREQADPSWSGLRVFGFSLYNAPLKT